MSVFTDAPRLKVMTPELGQSLAVFNEAARALQQMGFRIHHFDLRGNSLEIAPEAGRELLKRQLVIGLRRYPSAGSTRFEVVFQGVTLEWREPITTNPIDLTLH